MTTKKEEKNRSIPLTEMNFNLEIAFYFHLL